MNPLIVKLFIGCVLSTEIRMHLSESPAWKQLLIAPSHDRDLVHTQYQEREYIGQFFETAKLPFKELKNSEKGLREKLQNYCPKINVERLPIYIFPQVFIP